MKQKNLAIKFSEETSCHGILQITNTQRKWLKAFWILLVIIMFSMLIWQVVDRIKAYRKYDTNTQVSEEFVSNLKFPAITICNSNRYFGFSSKREGEELLKISRTLDTGIPQNISTVLGLMLPSNFSLRDLMVERGWKIDRPNTLVYCAISRLQLCTHANFTMSLSSSLGVCWTLNIDAKQSIAGFIHGIHLLVMTFQSNSTEDPLTGNPDSGIRFQVHPRDQPHQVDNLGYAVGTGLYASVPIHQQEITNMYSPWGACEPKKENLKFYSTYSLPACMKECYETAIQRTCNCRGPLMENFQHVKECSPIEVLNCTAPTRSLVESSLTPYECGCNHPCHQVKYSSSISYSTFPNPVHAAYHENNLNLTKGYIKENAVGLSVYFDEMSVTKQVQSKAITESALLSDIGGQLGLWLGVSVVTIFEFLQFITHLFYNKTKEFRKAQSSSASKTSNEMSSV